MGMFVIVCGDRNWTDVERIESVLEELHEDVNELAVIEGGAKGADRAAWQWAARNRKNGVGWIHCPANWETYGRAAGPRRNQEMLDYLLQARQQGHAIEVLAFHDDLENSRGTKDMVSRARRAGVTVVVYASTPSLGATTSG